jgi:hypothetical protein
MAWYEEWKDRRTALGGFRNLLIRKDTGRDGTLYPAY